MVQSQSIKEKFLWIVYKKIQNTYQLYQIKHDNLIKTSIDSYWLCQSHFIQASLDMYDVSFKKQFNAKWRMPPLDKKGSQCNMQ